MPCGSFPSRASSESGQSLLESALLLPFLLFVALNAINLGYFIFIALNVTASPRQGVEYSIQGFQTPSTPSLPSAGPACTGGTAGSSISTLTYQDMIGVLPTGSGTPCPDIASVQVCSMLNGLSNPGTTTQRANCTAYGPATTFPNADSDPEALYFILHRVDVKYTVTPLIPGGPGNFFSLFIPTLTFHRQASMRAMD